MRLAIRIGHNITPHTASHAHIGHMSIISIDGILKSHRNLIMKQNANHNRNTDMPTVQATNLSIYFIPNVLML